MKRHGNLFEQIIAYDNLNRAYDRAKRGKNWQRAVKRFERNREHNLMHIQHLLVTKAFTTSRYTKKIVHEPKRRKIYKLPFAPDRIVQHALLQVVSPIWDALMIPQSYACRPNKGMHQASNLCMDYVRKYKYCFKADISKFYPSINHDILMRIIRRKIKCRQTLWLIENIVRSFPGHKNVPIGNYTSQWFGNLYMNELDQWLRHTKKYTPYIRYCDDFVVFSDSKQRLQQLRKDVEEFLLTNLQLKFSRWSVFPVTQGVDFLGYRHFPAYKLLRKNTAKRVKRRLERMPGRLMAGEITVEEARGSLASTKGWMQWANTHNLAIVAKLEQVSQYVDFFEKEFEE